MSDSNKVWVIDDGQRPELTSLGDPLQTAPRPAGPSAGPRPAPRPVRPARPAPTARPATAPSPAPRRSLHPAILLGLGYLLGPLATVLSRRGRGAPWLALTLVWAAGAAALGLGWWAVVGGRAGASLVPWLASGTAALVAAGFTLWARALAAVAGGGAVAQHAWSPLVANPWTAVVLGLAAPGSAQVLVRRSRRAALTLWSAWPCVAALLATAQAPLLWRHRAAFAAWGLAPAALERALLAAALLAAVAPLLWLAQALEGGRVLAGRTGRWQAVRGDWSALALAASVAAALVALEPGTIAAGLGDYADSLAAEGCTVAPLLLVRTAQRLDPGQPAYALQAADLYAAAGEPEQARRVRTDLDRTLQPYLGALMREERRARGVPRPEPAAPPPATLLLPAPAPRQGPSGPPAPTPAPGRVATP